jgi:serine/threonine protein kinase, bacterial
MSYCLNPTCPHPMNPAQANRCQACGSGLKLHDRYRILGALGQGGFGATFLAKDESLPGHPNCVIKILRPNSTDESVIQMAQELFEREAKTLGKIGNHPQIPRLLDYFSANQSFHLVQEHVSGATLQQEVKRNGPFTETGVKQFLSEILPLLQYVHSQKVIHRDIKPANIIRRSQDSKLVLIDFGAVKDQVSQSTITGGGHTAFTSFAIGTAGFAPPEQMAMRPVYASDIYALGVTCLYLLTGKTPKDLDYDGATGEMAWQKFVRSSDHLVEVLRKMLEVSVRHRYQTAEEVMQAMDLEPYMDSLANSMTAQPSQRGAAGSKTSIYSPTPTASPSSQVVRPGNLQPGLSKQTSSRLSTGNSPLVGSPLAGSKARPKGPSKPTHTEVVNFYAKGVRDFSTQDLSDLTLQRAELSGTNFHEAKLISTNLQQANLYNCNFGRACLRSANLKNACLSKGYFSHADLQGADLRGADLSDAYLSNANLRGANLCGANLTGAKVTNEQLSLAKTNWSTISPEGKRKMW